MGMQVRLVSAPHGCSPGSQYDAPARRCHGTKIHVAHSANMRTHEQTHARHARVCTHTHTQTHTHTHTCLITHMLCVCMCQKASVTRARASISVNVMSLYPCQCPCPRPCSCASCFCQRFRYSSRRAGRRRGARRKKSLSSTHCAQGCECARARWVKHSKPRAEQMVAARHAQSCHPPAHSLARH